MEAAPRLTAPAGLASVLLLAASLRWAHHWGARTDALVAGWALATIAGLVLGVRAARTPRPPRLALLGLALALLSVLALVVAGGVWAAGYDPAGACGGG